MPAGLALLGASLPALGSLDEIAAAYGTTEKVSAYSTDEAGLQTPDTDDKKKEGESSMAMTPEEQKLLDDLKAENDALKKEIESLKAEMAKAAADHTAAATENADFKAKLADLEGKYAALTEKAKTADEDNFKAKFARKVTPADMELLVLPRYREIRDAGKTEDMSAFTKALTERKDHTMLSEHSRNDAGGPHAKGGKDYDALVKERCEKLGKDYKKLSASEYAAELREVGYVYEKPPMLDAEDDKGGSD
jgi:alanyl-tRNA synthetase